MAFAVDARDQQVPVGPAVVVGAVQQNEGSSGSLCRHALLRHPPLVPGPPLAHLDLNGHEQVVDDRAGVDAVGVGVDGHTDGALHVAGGGVGQETGAPIHEHFRHHRHEPGGGRSCMLPAKVASPKLKMPPSLATNR